MNKEIIPTFTLAKLYETQYQLVDAVNVYSKLNEKENSDELTSIIVQLVDVVFQHINKEYDPIISQIFSREELRYFKIIPGTDVKIPHDETEQTENTSFDISHEDKEDILSTGRLNNEQDEIAEKKDDTVYSELHEIEKKLAMQKENIQRNSLTENKFELEMERDELLSKLKTINEKLIKFSQKDPLNTSETKLEVSKLDIPSPEVDEGNKKD